MSLKNIASPSPSQGGADRGARPDHPEPTWRPGRSTARPYAAVPHDLTADTRLKPLDIKLIAILLRYARARSTCWPSVETLAHDLDRSERTTQYALKRLMSAGWVASRPDSNKTGRLIVLVWREANCTPPVQAPYSQGMPRPQPVAPKAETEEKREGSASAYRRPEPEKPKTHAELFNQYQDLGWLEKPLSDPLRQIAERSLSVSLTRSVIEPHRLTGVRSGRFS